MNKMRSFIEEFVARVNGDDAKAQAMKTWRQAENAIQTQIHALKGQTMEFEDRVEQTQEKANDAILNNGQLITSKTEFTRVLIQTENEVLAAEEALKNHLDTVAVLEKKLAYLHADKEAMAARAL